MEFIMNKTAFKILSFLFENPLQEFKEIEIIKKIKIGKGAAGEIINKLEEERVLAIKRVGKTKVISLNFLNSSSFFIKMLLDSEKIKNIDKTRVATILYFKELVKNNLELLIAFGSSIDKTAAEKSDIDLLVVGNTKKIEEARNAAEELFGKRINLHSFTREEIINRIKQDLFKKNVLLRGIVFYGYDLLLEAFSSLKEGADIERVLFLMERTKAALRNYMKKDINAAKDILEKTVEQLVFYILSENNISYTSKKNALKLIKNVPEGKIVKKINKSVLKDKIVITERFMLKMLINTLLQRR